jgi:hypothetical protein
MKDGTEYVPADATFAVGEIKSTFSRYEKPIQEFSRKLAVVATELVRPEIPNTAYGGLTDETLLLHLAEESIGAIRNPLLSFMICVDRGDFSFEDARSVLSSIGDKDAPGLVAVLNAGVLVRGRMTTDSFDYSAYPSVVGISDTKWLLAKPTSTDTGSLEGSVLGFLYATLLGHLRRSRLEPIDAAPYLAPLLQLRRGLIEGLEDETEASP